MPDRVVVANAFYIPSPVVMVSTISRDDVPDVSTMSAVGVLCLTPPIIGIGMKPSRQTYKNIRQTREFVINLPLEQDLHAADIVGTRKLRSCPTKLADAGLTLKPMSKLRCPGISGSPIVMGCVLVNILTHVELGVERASHHVVLGRITECIVDESWIKDEEVRLEEMPVLIYLNRYYAGVGKKLAQQRFTDDPEKQLMKMKEYRQIALEDEDNENS